MLDNPEKTTRLLAALKAAAPFEVELTERLLKHLQTQQIAVAEAQEVLVVSLTQVRVPRSMPLAGAIADYQKHRVKKLKKQGRG